MTQHYTQMGMTWIRGDFNYDGTVDGNDFNLFKPNYGITLPPPPAVPPAATIAPPSQSPSNRSLAPVVDKMKKAMKAKAHRKR